MRYKFKCDTGAKDCWQLYMHRIYHSTVGVCTLVFAVTMIALTVKFWGQSSTAVRIFLVVLCLLVPVVQPAGVYIRSAKQLAQLPKDMELWFGDAGIYVKAGEQTANISWKNVYRVSKESNMVILMTRDGRGYMLTNRALGQEKDDFYRYAASKIS